MLELICKKWSLYSKTDMLVYVNRAEFREDQHIRYMIYQICWEAKEKVIDFENTAKYHQLIFQ